MKVSAILDEELRINLNKAHVMVNEIHSKKAEFNSQLNDVNNSIISTLLSVENMITKLPTNILDDIGVSVRKEMNLAITTQNEIGAKKNLTFDILGKGFARS